MNRPYRRYTFTINFSDDNNNEQSARNIAQNFFPENFAEEYKGKYACWQIERGGESGRYHIQGYIHFDEPIRGNRVKSWNGHFQRAHLEAARGTAEENKRYCSKAEGAVEGSFTEIGSIERLGQGKRSDLRDASEVAKESRDLAKVAREYPSEFVKYHKGFERLIDVLYEPPRGDEGFVYRPWQRRLGAELDGPSEQSGPNSRRISFYVDEQGGAGKSEFGRQYYLRNLTRCVVFSESKWDRIYYNWRGQEVVIFDYPRNIAADSGSGSGDRLPYSVFEKIKDGYVPTGMFGRPSAFYRKPHVIVMLNFRPNMTALTQDRYDIVDLSEIN